MTSSKTIVIVLFVIGIAAVVYSAIPSPQTDQAFNNGMNYLVNSPNDIWNATDFAAFAIISKNFPNTYIQHVPIMELKKTFDVEQYPFTASLLFPSAVTNPSEFEMGLGTPALLKKLYSCESFTPEDFTEFSKKKNTIETPYDASHAILFLVYIQKQYEQNCGKPDQKNLAQQTIPLIIPGLSLESKPEMFDPYLEQECARGLATGLIKPDVVQLVLSSQDPVSGGWYHQQKQVNPDWFDEFSGKIQIGEYPNGHTSIFALCILSIELVKT